MEVGLNTKIDLLLVQQAKNGDTKAFEQLVSKYRQTLYAMILKMVGSRNDAEDLIMESFSKAYRNLDSYKEGYTFSTWLFKIATNHCIDFIRMQKIKVRPSVSISSDNNADKERNVLVIRDTTINPEEAVIKEQRRQKVREMVELLPPKYRDIITLFYYEELTYEKISQRTGIPLGAVRVLIFRGKQLLFELYNPNKEQY